MVSGLMPMAGCSWTGLEQVEIIIIFSFVGLNFHFLVKTIRLSNRGNSILNKQAMNIKKGMRFVRVKVAMNNAEVS